MLGSGTVQGFFQELDRNETDCTFNVDEKHLTISLLLSRGYLQASKEYAKEQRKPRWQNHC
jgi:hypothetical protein